MDSEPLLEISAVRIALGNGRWCGLDCRLEPGAIVQLGGPSGSGKTSLLRTIARLQVRSAGRLRVAGQFAEDIPATEWRRSIAFVPQHPAMLSGSVEDNLHAAFGLHIARGATYPGERAATLLRRLRLEPGMLAQDARSLSGGEAARVALIRALLPEPRILLLDEATAALDEDAARALTSLVSEYVREVKRAALVVAHNPDPWEGVLTGSVQLETGHE